MCELEWENQKETEKEAKTKYINWEFRRRRSERGRYVLKLLEQKDGTETAKKENETKMWKIQSVINGKYLKVNFLNHIDDFEQLFAVFFAIAAGAAATVAGVNAFTFLFGLCRIIRIRWEMRENLKKMLSIQNWEHTRFALIQL